jgi:hypothetical protein
MNIAVVYQGGICNVFEVEVFSLKASERKAKRLIQDAFKPCEWFARGLHYGGAKVTALGCNMAGDISLQDWTDDLESLPFCEQFGVAWMHDF